MIEMQPPRRIGRSIGALLAGFFLVVILSLGTDVGAARSRHLPAVGPADVRRALAAGDSLSHGLRRRGQLHHSAARAQPAHAARTGGRQLGLALSIVGTVVTWNQGIGPHWYPLALVATAMPCAWVGGKLRLLQLPATRP
jgi:hypothetical protein